MFRLRCEEKIKKGGETTLYRLSRKKIDGFEWKICSR